MTDIKLNYNQISELVYAQYRALVDAIYDTPYDSVERFEAEIKAWTARVNYEEIKACGYAEEAQGGDLYWQCQQELATNAAEEHRIKIKFAQLMRDEKLAEDVPDEFY